MSTVIEVDGLGKKYRLGQLHTDLLSERLGNGVRTFLNRFRRDGLSSASRSNQEKDFWALKDISFQIKEGEAVGIIGRNGAGKSTLLKILSRITAPTTGKVEIVGRVASLLEVGTGFHPELTGRENVFLNGAILGMSKVEIARKFDEIVAFAEIEKFINTPVKHYSSGMYVRLAFAVAAHLEPEILIVDEVLAVGDIQFQKKCLGKMEEVGKEGRTVLFVSHNMGAIKNLCLKTILLEQGKIKYNGKTEEAISYYLFQNEKINSYVNNTAKEVPYFTNIYASQNTNKSGTYDIDKPIEINILFNDLKIENIVITILIKNKESIIVYHSTDEFANKKMSLKRNCRKCIIPPYALARNSYSCTFALGTRNLDLYDKLENIINFDVKFTGITAEFNTENTWKAVTGPGILGWE